MLSTNDRLEHDIVFAGAGHANMLALRMLAMFPPTRTRLTLVSSSSDAAYSGMVPGYLAGAYKRDEICINLPAFCAKLGITFVRGTIIGLDSKTNQLRLKNRPPIGFDVISLNLGAGGRVSSHQENLIHAKPVHYFMSNISYLIDKIDRNIHVNIDVVGGGAAGVEIAMALKERGKECCDVALFHRSGLLTELGNSAASRARSALEQAGVRIMPQEWHAPRPNKVTIMAAGYQEQDIDFDGEPRRQFEVGGDLRLEGHNNIFVVGDMARFMPKKLPKSGVYAVRSAPILAHNLRSFLSGRQAKTFKPQRDFLRLVSLGTKNALANKYGVTLSAPIIWRWKDKIDQSFMRRFSDVPSMVRTENTPENQILCTGCAGKVSGSVLKQALGPDFTPEDAVRIGKAKGKLIASIDGMRSFIADDYLMARIATRHAFGDLLVSGARPQHILLNLALPPANEHILARRLQNTIKAVEYEANLHGASVAGGHSMEASDWLISLTIMGAENTNLIPKRIHSGPAAFVLTDAIGVGTMMAAQMHGAINVQQYDQLLNHLVRDMVDMGELQKSHPILAATDVTGFGIAGHLLEMLNFESHGVSWSDTALPVLTGAFETARSYPSSILQANQIYGALLPPHPHDPELLRFDPQTCGGYLLATSPDAAQKLVDSLRKAGHPNATIIATKS